MSTLKEYMIESLHELYRLDNWIINLYTGAGKQLDTNYSYLEQLLLNLFFDTSSTTALERFEKDLGLLPAPTESLEERRETIEARWKAGGKNTLALLQGIVDSYNNGTSVMSFISGSLVLTLYNSVGSLTKFKKMISQILVTKPAHLAFLVQNYFWGKEPVYVGGLISQRKHWIILPTKNFTITGNTNCNSTIIAAYTQRKHIIIKSEV